jgi:hypothetical protein
LPSSNKSNTGWRRLLGQEEEELFRFKREIKKKVVYNNALVTCEFPRSEYDIPIGYIRENEEMFP